MWGLQFAALFDSEFPVWYPYYGNWVAAIVVETALLVASTVLHRPVDVYDFISVSISGLCACNFIILFCVYLAARNREGINENDDAERQSLLRSEILPGASNSEDPGQNANEYGATDDSSDDESNKKTEEEEASEDYWFKRQRENEEKIAKRLKADGNWWSYCKGFFVRISCLIYVILT